MVIVDGSGIDSVIGCELVGIIALLYSIRSRYMCTWVKLTVFIYLFNALVSAKAEEAIKDDFAFLNIYISSYSLLTLGSDGFWNTLGSDRFWNKLLFLETCHISRALNPRAKLAHCCDRAATKGAKTFNGLCHLVIVNHLKVLYANGFFLLPEHKLPVSLLVLFLHFLFVFVICSRLGFENISIFASGITTKFYGMD